MILIYSALRDQPEPGAAQPNENDKKKNYSLRYRAYREACEKYGQDIDAIRKYFPGWAPAPPVY